MDLQAIMIYGRQLILNLIGILFDIFVKLFLGTIIFNTNILLTESLLVEILNKVLIIFQKNYPLNRLKYRAAHIMKNRSLYCLLYPVYKTSK